jgi:transcriptional regulator with PAS, ATPase and Fis domain
MPSAIQVKMLRVLEDKEIRPVGSTKPKRIDIRLISATNKDLRESVQQGAFREDLYYRMNVITLQMPPLRERREDIPALLEHYLEKYSREFSREEKRITSEALSLLSAHHWPGNIRELQNVVERAVLISDGSDIDVEHLPDNIHREGEFLEQSTKKELSIEEYTRNFILNYQAGSR